MPRSGQTSLSNLLLLSAESGKDSRILICTALWLPATEAGIDWRKPHNLKRQQQMTRDLLAGFGQLTASKETLESQAQKSQELGQLQGSQEQQRPLNSLGRRRCQRHPLLLLLTSGS